MPASVQVYGSCPADWMASSLRGVVVLWGPGLAALLSVVGRCWVWIWGREDRWQGVLGGASDAVRAPFARRADAVRIVGIVAVRFESGRLQERLKWRKWLFRGSVLYQID